GDKLAHTAAAQQAQTKFIAKWEAENLKQLKTVLDNLKTKYALLPVDPGTEVEKGQQRLLENLIEQYERQVTAQQALLQPGPTVASQVNSRNIAWGKPVRGLQAGIRLAENTHSGIFPGQYLQLEVRIRNIGAKPITVSYWSLPENRKFAWNGVVEN